MYMLGWSSFCHGLTVLCNKTIKDKWGALLYNLGLNTLAGDDFWVVVKLRHLLLALEGVQNMYYQMGAQLHFVVV